MKKAAFWTVSRGSLGRRGRRIPAARGEALKASMVALALALAGSVLLPAQSEAQGEGLTCGWCSSGTINVTWPDGSTTECEDCHAFFRGGDACGWGGSDWPSTICARCGGRSFCHRLPWPGPCHVLCGPDGDLTAELSGVQEALDQGDVTVVATALLRERAGASLEFVPEAGRIDVVLACSPDRVTHVIPVLPAVRERLEAELSTRAAAIIGRQPLAP